MKNINLSTIVKLLGIIFSSFANGFSVICWAEYGFNWKFLACNILATICIVCIAWSIYKEIGSRETEKEV